MIVEPAPDSFSYNSSSTGAKSAAVVMTDHCISDDRVAKYPPNDLPIDTEGPQPFTVLNFQEEHESTVARKRFDSFFELLSRIAACTLLIYFANCRMPYVLAQA